MLNLGLNPQVNPATQLVPLVPRDYQVECLSSNGAYYSSGITRLLNALPTGCGKAVIFAQVPKIFGHLGRLLVIAHREELLDQAAGQIQRANPVLYVGIEQADRHASPFDDVVVASVQTLSNTARLLRVAGAEGFGVVVIDEAHHAIAASYIKVLSHLGLAPDIEALEEERRHSTTKSTKSLNDALKALHENYQPDPKKLLMGFTATPHRTDGIGLQYLFDQMAYSKTIKEMMQAGWLCPIRGLKIDTGADISGVKSQAGDYKVGELSKAVNNTERNELAVKMWEAHAKAHPICICGVVPPTWPDYHATDCPIFKASVRTSHVRPTIVFCVDVEHTEAMCEAFQDAGYKADLVVGKSPKDDRRGVIDAFKAGKLDVLVNCMVLTEGFDHAPTSCIVMARPTKSSLLYTQMLGRGTRLSPETGKQELLVLDLVDVAKAGVATVNTLFGLPPKLSVEKDVLEVLEEVEEILAQTPVAQGALDMALTLEDVRTISTEFNPLQEAAMPEYLDSELELQWVCTSFGYTLSAGGVTLGVVEDLLGHCTVEISGCTTKNLGIEFSIALDALKVAETWLLDNIPDSYQFSAKQAPWRVQGAKQPATSSQLYHLRRGKVKFPENISKADASILLSRVFAQKGRRS